MPLTRAAGGGPGVARSRVDSLQRLHGLALAMVGDLDLSRTLQSVCQGVVDGLGFEVAVLNLVMPDGGLDVVVCAGDEAARAALIGTSATRESWDELMALCEPVGELLIDYLHLAAPTDAGVATWIPDRPCGDAPDSWDPRDRLFAPLRTARAGLLGVISVDLPRDGRRPRPEQLELLEMYAAQASIALENAQLHAALLRQHEAGAEALGRLSLLVESTPVGIVELDLEGRVRLWNPAAERIFGWCSEEAVGRPNPVVDTEGYQARLQAIIDAPVVLSHVRRKRRDGTLVEVERSSSVLRDEHGRPSGFLSVYADLTERVLLEEELRTAAHTDPLTGLANRALFGERLLQAAASGRGATLLLFDLDGFKSVNDRAGHAAGDLVLVEVARRTVAACRAGDLVARLGGDEFVVLLGGSGGRPLDDVGAEVLAERLVEALAEPFPVGHGRVALGASVGLARLSGRGSADDLLRDADVAMYAAKSAGKSQFRVYEPELRATLLERSDLVADLRDALARRDQLFVRWHPVVRVADQRLLGFEALVRWQHPTRGELAPGRFVQLAEQSGLVDELGRQVLQQSCETLVRWQRTVPGSQHTQISVNLSPVQVHGGVVAMVRDVLADTGVHPGHLLLELTEDVLLEDVDVAVEVLLELRSLGVRLAIDDFGAGYSSLAYLKRLPVDVVKLDRSLLQGIETDPSGVALFDAVVGLVRRLGVTAVAEGVETVGQWRLLERLRCPVAQGFLLAEPLLEQDVPRLLALGRPSSGMVRAR